jgi:Na+/H+-dicarboxylate symporter
MFYKISSMTGMLLIIILTIICFGKFIPLQVYQFLYAISLSIKSIIIFLLPFIIFGLLFRTTIHLVHNATRIISLILIGVCCSSVLALFTSHMVGTWIYNFDLSILLPENQVNLEPAWIFNLPKLIANDKAMFAGIILGIILNWKKLGNKINKLAERISIKLEVIISIVLKWFTFLIPLFISGFIAKLQYEGIVSLVIRDYSLIFIIIALAQFIYILLAYFLLSNYKVQGLLTSIKNMLPAAISGFSTMSSAASMPLTIMGAENNAKLKDLARSVIPATVNIHLVGDCFATPILAYAVLKNYSMIEPSLINYAIFTFYFILAKFSVAAVPGGGIIVMLPVLEAHLGFNAEMMSLITALYILFDPVITCVNILGNGAFAKLMDKLWFWFSKKEGSIT